MQVDKFREVVKFMSRLNEPLLDEGEFHTEAVSLRFQGNGFPLRLDSDRWKKDQQIQQIKRKTQTRRFKKTQKNMAVPCFSTVLKSCKSID